ncbi:MAG TPA: hypothetical protein VFV87_18740, partial [Pirellulaceae bacterium]|nr:hypothetical protein [Pirellulaceae bacterium]
MTDQQLVELLEHKTPEELTPEEVELLRSRLDESAELRERLMNQLQMETYLATALARVEITPEKIVARAQQQTPASSGGVFLVLVILICLPLLVLGAAALRYAVRQQGTSEVATTAHAAPAGPANIDPTGKEKSATQNEAPAKNEATAGTHGADPARETSGKMPPPAAAGDRSPRTPPKPPSPADVQTTEGTKPPAAKSPPAPPPAPWQPALDQSGEPPPFAEIAFQPLDTAKSIPQREDLSAWFEKGPDSNLQLHRVDTRYGPCGAIEGVARLKSPWPQDSALRLALENYKDLMIHCYHGQQGVT